MTFWAFVGKMAQGTASSYTDGQTTQGGGGDMFSNSGNAGGLASLGAGDVGADGGNIYDDGGIIVSSIGVNLGEILQPYTQGAPTNGGSDVQPQSRWVTSNLSATTSPAGSVSIGRTGSIPNGVIYAIAGGAALVAFLIFRKRG